MSKTGETTPAKDQLLYYKIAANGVILLFVCLGLIPAVHRHLARIGLTFTAPDRPKREADVPAIDPQTGHTIAPWAYGPGGRLCVLPRPGEGLDVVAHRPAEPDAQCDQNDEQHINQGYDDDRRRAAMSALASATDG